MNKSVLFKWMIALAMCIQFNTLTAAAADEMQAKSEQDARMREKVSTGKLESQVKEGVPKQKNLDDYVKDQQRDLENYKKDITEQINGLQTGSPEEKQAAIAKRIKEREDQTANNIKSRTRELYKYQGEPTEEIKQQMQSDKAAKEAFDQTPGGDREKYEGAVNSYATSMGYPKYGELPNDPRFREGIQKQQEIESYKKDISEKIEGLQATPEDKQAGIAKLVKEKTREVYKFQGEPSEAIKEKMKLDTALKKMYGDASGGINDQKLSNYTNEMTLPFIRQMANPVTQEKRASGTTPSEAEATPTTEDEDAATQTIGTLTPSDAADAIPQIDPSASESSSGAEEEDDPSASESSSDAEEDDPSASESSSDAEEDL